LIAAECFGCECADGVERTTKEDALAKLGHGLHLCAERTADAWIGRPTREEAGAWLGEGCASKQLACTKNSRDWDSLRAHACTFQSRHNCRLKADSTRETRYAKARIVGFQRTISRHGFSRDEMSAKHGQVWASALRSRCGFVETFDNYSALWALPRAAFSHRQLGNGVVA
jgi:hypothetical protein